MKIENPSDIGFSDDAVKGGTRLRRVVLAACIGSAMEWYDFFIYGFIASLVFDQLFFPNMSPTFGRIVVLTTFSAGFVARPLGGLVFAHFGDRIGRKKVLMTTMVLMGASTTAIGLLPVYREAGVVAPVLLIVCRLIQGIALGGESIGALLMTVETAPAARRGFYAALVMSTGTLAQVLGSLVIMLLTRVSNDVLLAWAWRVPFLLSSVLLIVGVYVRRRVEESPVFQQAVGKHRVERFPVAEVFRRFKVPALVVLLCALAESTCFNLSTTFSLSYGTHVLHISRAAFTTSLFIGLSIATVMVIVCGALSDRFGRVRIFGIGVMVTALSVWPFLTLLGSGETVLVTLAIIVVVGFVHPLMFGPEGALFPELFDTSVRFSGVTVGKQMGTLIGGSVPLIASAILAATGGRISFIVLYVLGVCAAALIALSMAWLKMNSPKQQVAQA
jgi:MFS transporter, MHS family, shikimate and dehydroshikimate transport protein